MVRFAWLGWWLGLAVGMGVPAAAQSREPDTPPVELRENFPNPVVTATTIPFRIAPELCSRGRQPLVSLRIYNVLVQVVAVPTLVESDEPLENVRLRCGEHRAYWDGTYLAGGGEATPGVYYYQLTVNDERYTRKMIVQRKVASRK